MRFRHSLPGMPALSAKLPGQEQILSRYFSNEYCCIAQIAKRLIEIVRIRMFTQPRRSRMQRNEALNGDTRFGIDSQTEGRFKIKETRYFLTA